MNAPPLTPEDSRADIFISHASEDKDIARPLAESLRRRGLVVWYDEYVLRLGDSLRGVIDRGLASARFGVVILSPRFFAKEWPQRELNGFLARETVNRTKVLLPIWHDLTIEEVARHSPILADRLAVSTDRGIEYVVEQILDVLEADSPRPAGATPGASPSIPIQAQAAKAPAAPAIVRPTAKLPIVKIPATKPTVSKAPTTKAPIAKTSPVKPPGKRLSSLRLRITITVVSLIVIGITVSGLLTDWRKRESALRPTEASRDVKPTVGTFAELEKKAALAQMRSEVEALETLITAQRRGTSILTDVWHAIPELLWLDKLSDEKGTLTLEGRAFNTNAIAALLENIDTSPNFGKPSLVSTEPSGNIYRFVMQMDHSLSPIRETGLSFPSLQQRREELLGKVPTPGILPAALDLVRSTLEESNLHIKTFQLGQPLRITDLELENSGMIEAVPVEISVSGSFGNLVAFAKRFETISFPAAVMDLSLRALGGSGDTVSCALRLSVPRSKYGTEKANFTAVSIELPLPLKKLRDPFKPLIAASVTRLMDRSESRPDGIPGLLINECNLIGIFRTSRDYVAQVVVQREKKSYLLRAGDQLYDGDVVSINRNEVVFKQVVSDPAASKPFREVVKVLVPDSIQ